MLRFNMRSFYSLVILIALGTSFCIAAASQAQSGKGDYDEAMEKGRRFMTSGKLDDAVKEYKNAIKLSDGKEYLAYWGLAQTYYRLNATKSVLDTCKRILEIASDDHARAEAYNMNGIAVLKSSEGNKKALADAEAWIRKALEVDPNFEVAHFNLGKTLMAE